MTEQLWQRWRDKYYDKVTELNTAEDALLSLREQADKLVEAFKNTDKRILEKYNKEGISMSEYHTICSSIRGAIQDYSKFKEEQR